MKLNRTAYETLIEQDIDALIHEMPNSLERQHIEQVLRLSVTTFYPDGSEAPPLLPQQEKFDIRDRLQDIFARHCISTRRNSGLITDVVKWAADAARQSSVVSVADPPVPERLVPIPPPEAPNLKALIERLKNLPVTSRTCPDGKHEVSQCNSLENVNRTAVLLIAGELDRLAASGAPPSQEKSK